MNYLGAYGDDDDDDEASRLEERRRRQVAQKLSSYTAPKDLLIPRCVKQNKEKRREEHVSRVHKKRQLRRERERERAEERRRRRRGLTD